jgi:phenylpropionate dioxygenase-like ring-hydroxylating dioxygenase large terminal subunit
VSTPENAPPAISGLPAPGRVDKQRYLSREFAEAERQRLWPRTWLHAAALDLLPTAGRFVRVELGGADVLVIRGQDLTLRAFHNVCQHRGRRLVDAPCGEVEVLRCPLHHWQWSTEGKLVSVPDRGVFGSLLDDSPTLSALACDTWGGQVWIHIGPPRESLGDWLAPAVAAFEHYYLDDYALVEQAAYDVPCNWKTVADQFNEAYHVRTVHPYLLGAVDDTSVQDEAFGAHVFSSFRIGRPSPRVAEKGIGPALAEFLSANDVDPASLGNDATRAEDALKKGMRARGIDRLTDDELLSCRNWSLFPSLRLSVYAHMLQIDRYRPNATDPERSWLDQLTFQRLRPGEPRPTPRVVEYTCTGEEASGKLRVEGGAQMPRVVEDDVREMVAVQRGMHSPGFRSLRLGGHERRILHMHAVLDRYLAVEP